MVFLALIAACALGCVLWGEREYRIVSETDLEKEAGKLKESLKMVAWALALALVLLWGLTTPRINSANPSGPSRPPILKIWPAENEPAPMPESPGKSGDDHGIYAPVPRSRPSIKEVDTATLQCPGELTPEHIAADLELSAYAYEIAQKALSQDLGGPSYDGFE